MPCEVWSVLCEVRVSVQCEVWSKCAMVKCGVSVQW